MSDIGKITKHHSLKHADLILAELRKIWPKTWEGWLRCWSNGREQGYHLTVFRWNDKRGERSDAACVFSEGRSCDGALVVIGPRGGFKEFAGLGPSDVLWEDHVNSRKYFYNGSWSPDKKNDGIVPGRGNKNAAKWIVARFRKLLAESLKNFRKAKREYAASTKAKAS